MGTHLLSSGCYLEEADSPFEVRICPSLGQDAGFTAFCLVFSSLRFPSTVFIVRGSTAFLQHRTLTSFTLCTMQPLWRWQY